MNLALSILAIIAPLAIYWLVIRPRLQARFADTYAQIDGWWARQWARIVAFRTWIFGAVGLVIPEIAELAQFAINFLGGFNGMDVSFMPDWLAKLIRVGALIAVVWNQARKTTPEGQGTP